MNVTLGIESFTHHRIQIRHRVARQRTPGAEFGLANGINNFLEKDVQTLFPDKANQQRPILIE